MLKVYCNKYMLPACLTLQDINYSLYSLFVSDTRIAKLVFICVMNIL